jgi:uncharacterized protein (DUF433 family)
MAIDLSTRIYKLFFVNFVKNKTVMIDYKPYITINSQMRFGKPTIIGTRITVFDILYWMSNGMTINEIIEDFPELHENQIKACLSYAADREHKIQIVS